MPGAVDMKPGFVEKLVERLDRLDPRSLQGYFLRLAQEKGLLETIFQSDPGRRSSCWTGPAGSPTPTAPRSTCWGSRLNPSAGVRSPGSWEIEWDRVFGAPSTASGRGWSAARSRSPTRSTAS